jgi:hypothetical protein
MTLISCPHNTCELNLTCLPRLSHPCEGCGHIGGEGVVYAKDSHLEIKGDILRSKEIKADWK